MRTQLQALRDVMAQHRIDAYLIPTDDFHGSEYVGDHFQCRKYISGFTGSAGTLVVTGENLHIGKLSLDGGELHVDGRIDSVSYEDGVSDQGGFFRRLFG